MTRGRLFLLLLLTASLPVGAALNPAPPDQPVKLVFIHHSTGENLLRNDYGGLGLALKTNRYFVSDSNYGWGPNAIGDRTDIPDWLEWFRSADTPEIMTALFAESAKHASYSRLSQNPGGPNEVILFKSCFPNSNLSGSPDDPPVADDWMTVGQAKYVYIQILKYFKTRPDKLFVVLTAPPVQDGTYAANARAFNQWLMNDWLAAYPYKNVAVFDFYNVLTDPNAHHRYRSADGSIEHAVVAGHDTLVYPSGDDHPSEAGSRKAVAEFVPLLNVFYHAWKEAALLRTVTFYSDPAQDGWILESGENTGTGGGVNSNAASFLVGDQAGNRQYRSIVSFFVDLPTQAVVTAATVKLKRQETVGTDPFTTHGRLLADIRRTTFGGNAGLVPGDFSAAATLPAAGSLSPPTTGNGFSLPVTGAGLPCVKPGRLVQFRLRFEQDDDNDFAADSIRFFSGNADPSNRPKLVIQYVSPTP